MKPRRQKRDGGRTAVLITKCTPELRRAIEADARSRGITIGRAMVERLTAGLEAEPALGRTCAWCSTVITKGREVTHTICPDCSEKVLAEMEER